MGHKLGLCVTGRFSSMRHFDLAHSICAPFQHLFYSNYNIQRSYERKWHITKGFIYTFMFFKPGRFISQKKISQYNIHLFQQQYSKSTTSTKAKTQRRLKLNIQTQHTLHFSQFNLSSTAYLTQLQWNHSWQPPHIT